MMSTQLHRAAGILLAGAMLAGVARADDTSSIRSETFTVDGAEIHYRIGGHGPHLLLLHGFTLTGHAWDPFLEAFMQRYTVVVADLPGHGHSSDVEGRYDFRKTARAMHALLDRLGAKRVLGMGHSAGGITLLHMTLGQPDRFDAMVLIDTPHRFGKAGIDLLRGETFESLSDELLAFYRDMHPRGDSQIKRLHDHATSLAEHHQEFAVPPEQLAAIKTPAFIVWGDRDVYLPVELATELYGALPDARLWVVPGQGHTPVFTNLGGSPEAAEMFPVLVTRFFNERAPRAPAQQP